MSILKGSNLILNSLLLRSKKTLIPSSVFHNRSITFKFPPPSILEIIKPYQDLGDPLDRNSNYLDKVHSYGCLLPPLKQIYKTSDNKVELQTGRCINVWVRAYLDPNNTRVWFEADSDHNIPKGLASVLFKGLSGRSVFDLTPDFFALLINSLQRKSPDYLDTDAYLLKMIEFIQKKCLVLAEEATARARSRVLERTKAKLERELGPAELELNVRRVSNELEGKTVYERRVMLYALLNKEDEGKTRSIITTLPPNIQEIIKPIQDLGSPMVVSDRFYGKLASYSYLLPPLNDIHKTSDNKVEGLDSGYDINLWARAYLDPDNDKVWFEADSDFFVPKGLAFLIFNGLSGRPVTELTPDFFTLLILSLKSLERKRNCPEFKLEFGFEQSELGHSDTDLLKMLEFLQKKCLVLAKEATARAKSAVLERTKEKLESELGPAELELNVK